MFAVLLHSWVITAKLITNNSDNITNKAQNTEHKNLKAQTQKYNN